MKFSVQRSPGIKTLLLLGMAALVLPGCHKLNWPDHHDDQGFVKLTKEYSSEVVLKWIDMQMHLSSTNPTPIGGLSPSRFPAYSAIAIYESVVPGMPLYQTLTGQLTGMPAMPHVVQGKNYHWPSSANASLAAMSRNFFPNTTDANKASIDSLENALSLTYLTYANPEVIQRSIEFGKEIAMVIFDWSKTDGVANANAPYNLPAGPGFWVPTPPGFGMAIAPYWGNSRLFVSSSLQGTAPAAPPTYSTAPASDYYKMVKEVYDVSQALTPDQLAMSIYYRDNPGYGGAHYLSILKQVLQTEQPALDRTAIVFTRTYIALFDALVGCFQAKYIYNQERSVTFIRNILGHTEWNSVFPTPAFPDFPSAHAVASGAFETILTSTFGTNYKFTNHTYDYLGMAPQSYDSFADMAIQIGISRVDAGIHNNLSSTAGRELGNKIGKNVENALRFRKY